MDNGQDLRKKHEFKDQSWIGLKTRSRDATLSRHKGININELYLHTKVAQTATGRNLEGEVAGERDCRQDFGPEGVHAEDLEGFQRGVPETEDLQPP